MNFITYAKQITFLTLFVANITFASGKSDRLDIIDNNSTIEKNITPYFFNNSRKLSTFDTKNLTFSDKIENIKTVDKIRKFPLLSFLDKEKSDMGNNNSSIEENTDPSFFNFLKRILTPDTKYILHFDRIIFNP